MEEDQEIVNGIDGSTGRYLPSPAVRDVLARDERPLRDPVQFREYQWFAESFEDPNREPVQQADATKLEQAGWAVMYGPGIKPEVKDALGILLNRRKIQAGALFKEFDYVAGQNKQDFLVRQGAQAGPAEPNKIPYYVLLVGDPTQIPYRFQYELDVQYAVGRLCFEKVEHYRHYAESVVAAETGPPRANRMIFFGPRNPDDPATQGTSSELIEPLHEAMERLRVEGAWFLDLIVGEQATKQRLKALLGGPETPALLFTASHGMAFPKDHDLQRNHQGALLCQDWPGPKKWKTAIPESFYFSADDVPRPADLRGLIACHVACYSAGTPAYSDFDRSVLGGRREIAAQPFLAPLAQRLLGHEDGGALAVLGHIDRAWTTSFRSKIPGQIPLEPAEAAEIKKAKQIAAFESALRRLLEGHPLGSATEFINQRHADLSVQLSGLWADNEDMLDVSKQYFAHIWRANNDARNFIVLGDPAVRLAGAPWPVKKTLAEEASHRAPIVLQSVQGKSGHHAAESLSAGGDASGMPRETLELFLTATGTPHTYQIAASSSCQGQVTELVSLLHLAEESKSLQRARERPTTAEELRAFGTRLFEALFAGDVRVLYERTLGQLSNRAQGSRLRLRMDAPELTVLPWELLFDPGRQRFVATDPRCSLSRSLTLLEPMRPLSASLPLRILVVQPVSAGLDLAEEDEVLEQVKATLGAQVQILRLSERCATPEALRSALRNDPHIVHFAGHAAFRESEAVVFLDHPDGMPRPMPAPAFAHLFLERPTVQLVVLNACEGASRSAHRALAGAAPWLLRHGLPAVVAMQWPVTNSEAGLFATELYRELCRRTGADLEAALARARGALFQERSHSPAFANPVLYLRAYHQHSSLTVEEGERSEQREASSPPAPVQPAVQSMHNKATGAGSVNVAGNIGHVAGGIQVHGSKRDEPR